MKECAFCASTADMSLEHVIGDWISKCLPGDKILTRTDNGKVSSWPASTINWTAKVVCEPCNNGWMSDLENDVAKPALSPLIEGNVFPLTLELNHFAALAAFAFKTAVVVDHSIHRRDPFLSRRVRHAFRTSLSNIPRDAEMWMGTYIGGDPARVDAIRYSGVLASNYPLKAFTLTCHIGALAFQVTLSKHTGVHKIYPLPGFEHLAIPFWPLSPARFIWPVRYPMDRVGFVEFGKRWTKVGIDI